MAQQPMAQRRGGAGAVALVTGAASGIGRGVTARFAQAGWRVLALDRDAERLDAVWGAGGQDAAAGERVTPVLREYGRLVFSSTKCPEPERAINLARSAEEAGFSTLWAPEHVVVPVEYRSAYGFSSDGKIQAADRDFPDPLAWLSFVAAATSTIRLGTGILILPQHNPVILAKRTATLDKLSGGRFINGAGLGWFREEFEAVSVPFDDRGSRADEQIAVMRKIWGNDVAGFQGEHYSFAPLKSFPKPARGYVPVCIGGDSRVAARRAGRLGNGFFPAMWPTERVKRELPGLLDVMRSSARAAGRDPAAIEVTAGGATTAEEARWFADQGVHQLTTAVHARNDAGIRDELLRFGDDVIRKTEDL
jgi:probable F420-dependent oxidoreductase